MIERAFAWLCKQRREYSANNDVWNARWRWERVKPRLQRLLLDGEYRFGSVKRLRGRGRTVFVWPALDALVLKALALVLTGHLQPHLSRRCYHLAGRGGSKAAARLDEYTFVLRTDVRGPPMCGGLCQHRPRRAL